MNERFRNLDKAITLISAQVDIIIGDSLLVESRFEVTNADCRCRSEIRRDQGAAPGGKRERNFCIGPLRPMRTPNSFDRSNAVFKELRVPSGVV